LSIYFKKTYQRSFGTYRLTGETCGTVITEAIAAGYRSFDTAQAYGNEADVGHALAQTGVPRSALCVTTKVDVNNFTEARFLASVEKSLRDLRLDRVDVLLLHWPTPGGDIEPSLRLLKRAQDEGLASHIGVSNYTAAMMRKASEIVDGPLVTNQVEFHPLLNQDKLLAAAFETGIPLSSFCSVARGKVFEFPLFSEIGVSYGKSAAQVVLRWTLQKGVSLNTMSTKPDNIRASFDIMDFTLSSIDMARIEVLTRTNYRIVGKDRVPYAPDFD
jgi:2,5-diketo-D-gluconate reductase B